MGTRIDRADDPDPVHVLQREIQTMGRNAKFLLRARRRCGTRILTAGGPAR